jgi:hypothetical protein
MAMARSTATTIGYSFRWSLVSAFCWLLAVHGPLGAAEPPSPAGARAVKVGTAPDAKALFWLESSLRRVYPDTPPGSTELQLIAPRNGRVSFQACLRTEDVNGLSVECQIAGADDLKPRVRWVGLVPLKHFTPDTPIADVEGVGNVPGMVPDPLQPISRVNFGPRQSHAFWVTLRIPSDATVGQRELTVRFTARGGEKGAKEQVVELPVRLEVSPLVLQPRKDFPVIHWWRGEATWDYYRIGMFEDPKWWEITRAQLENMLDHGSDVVYVPIFFDRRETFKRPCQLLVIEEPTPGKYTFDWTRTKKFVDMCKEVGFTKFEWSHLWIYWGAENPVRVYRKQGDQHVMLWPPEISGFSDTFLNFLKQFLPEFKAFLDKEGLLEHSYFHLSDEPGPGQHLANYKRARQILRDLAPWMKVMDALSDVEYGRQGLTDIPIPLVSAAQAYIDERIPHWVYYCCVPTGEWLNRFLDTPLTKIRMSGMIFYRLKADGFLHWGFNYWHRMEQEIAVDPFFDNTGGGGVPAGDPFVIYPGGDGKPMDSIRWEVFAESLQDYAILQTAGISPDDPMLADIKSYKDFPRQEEWIRRTIEQVLRKPPAPAAGIQGRRGAGALPPENTTEASGPSAGRPARVAADRAGTIAGRDE